jgi:hypothetical protein
LLIYVISIIKNLRRQGKKKKVGIVEIKCICLLWFSHLRHQQQSRKEDRKKKLRSLRSRGFLSLSLSLSCFAPLFNGTWEGDIVAPPCIDKKISVARSVV